MSDIRIQQNIVIGKTNSISAPQKTEDTTTPQTQPQAPAVNQKSADEVLNFLSNSALISPNVGSKAKSSTIQVSKYVSPEQAAGIADSVNKFFAGMEAHVGQAMKEFNLTPSQAQNLTATQFNQKMDDENFAIVATGQQLIIK